jgi:hypothetical protein
MAVSNKAADRFRELVSPVQRPKAVLKAMYYHSESVGLNWLKANGYEARQRCEYHRAYYSSKGVRVALLLIMAMDSDTMTMVMVTCKRIEEDKAV